MLPYSPAPVDDNATFGLRAGAMLPALGLPGLPVIHAELLRRERPAPPSVDELVRRAEWQYQVDERIGAGGMGVVYRARHLWLGRNVAIKFLNPTDQDAQELVARFAHEARAIGALDHPNIVRATDAGVLDGVHFLVTEYIDGVDLAELVRGHGPLRPADACELVRQAALGLEHAHQQALVHRDIKPSNLIVDRSGTVKLLDFGLARLTAAPTMLTSTGQMIGTLDFLAPEQAADARAVDIRSDIYGLGCTLYFLLCGHAPFSGAEYATPASKLKGHLADQPTSLADRAPGVPLAVVSIVERMLAKQPEDRFATPRDVAEALARHARSANLAKLVTAPRVRGLYTAGRSLSGWHSLGRLGRRITGWLCGRPRSKRAGAFGPAAKRKPIVSTSGLVLLMLVVVALSRTSCVPLSEALPWHGWSERISGPQMHYNNAVESQTLPEPARPAAPPASHRTRAMAPHPPAHRSHDTGSPKHD